MISIDHEKTKFTSEKGLLAFATPRPVNPQIVGMARLVSRN